MRALLLSPLLAAPLLAQEGFPPARIPNLERMDGEVAQHLLQQVAKVEATPADGEAHAELGLAYEANTCYAPAAQSYRNTVALLPDKPEWSYRLGVVLVATGELEEARTALERAAASLKGTPVIQARLGSVRFDLGDLEGAAQAWEAAITAEAKQEGNPKFPQSRVGLAQVRFEQGRYQDAIALAEEAIQLSPTYRHAHYVLSQCLFEIGEEERAELELSRGINAWPQFPPDPHSPRLNRHARGHHNRMMGIENMLASGAFAQAEQLLRRILLARSEDAFALNLLAKCEQGLGQPEQALETLRKSEEADPYLVDTKVMIAVALLNKAGVEPDPEVRVPLIQEAQAKTTAAVGLAPRQGRVRFFHGLALLSGGDAQGAYNEMSLGMMLGCDEPQMYQQLTSLSAQMGRLDQMIEFAERNAAERPDDPGALQLLVQAYLTYPRLDDAEALLPRLLSFNNPQLTANVSEFKKFIAQKRAQQRADEDDQ